MRTSSVLLAVFFIAFSTACGRGPSGMETGAHNVSLIGGTTASPGDEVARSVVQLRTKGSNGSHLCTGVLISKTRILTAAHCILVLRQDRENLEYRENFEIVFDVNTMTTDRSRVRGVKEIFTHADYEPDHLRCRMNPAIYGCDVFLKTPVEKRRPYLDAAIIILDRPAPSGTLPLKVFQGKPPQVFDAIVTGAGARLSLDYKKEMTTAEVRKITGRLDSFQQTIVLTSNPFQGRIRNAWGSTDRRFEIETKADRSPEKGDSGAPLLIRTPQGLQIFGILEGGSNDGKQKDGRTIERSKFYTDLTRDGWVNMNAN